MQSKSALRVRRINNFVESWCLVAAGGLKFEFRESVPTEKVLKTLKNWIFDDPFHKIDQFFVPGIIKQSESLEPT